MLKKKYFQHGFFVKIAISIPGSGTFLQDLNCIRLKELENKNPWLKYSTKENCRNQPGSWI